MNQRGALCACVIALAALLPASARAQIQPGGSVLIDKTPIVGGTTGRCLYDNAGKIGETASCGLAGGITVGTSVITGGTTTRVLYDNAGVLGEYTSGALGSFLGLGTAATQNTGTSGATIPLLSTANTFALAQTFTAAPVFSDAAGTRTALSITTVGTAAVGQVPGTTTNDNAASGKVGEELETTAAIGSVSISNNTAKTIASQSLTAGDWDVWCQVVFSYAATTNYTNQLASISATDNTLDTTIFSFSQLPSPSTAGTVPGNGVSITLWVGPKRITQASTNTYYCVGYSVFSVSTATAGGGIRVRRMR